MYQAIQYEVIDRVAVIQLNDPDKMNALSPEMIDELHQSLAAVEADRDIRALVIWGGNEKFFCAGGNIKAMLEMSVQEGYEISRRSHRLYDRIEGLKIPTVALVGGLAFGGGFELSLACDFRVVNEKAKFGLTEVTLGLIPGGGGTSRLPRMIGAAKAKELMLTGKVINAQEADRLNLVTKIVPVGSLKEMGLEFARELAQKAPLSVELMKSLVQMGDSESPAAAFEMEARAFSTLFASEDAKEGMLAFLEKRQPEYKGR